MQPRDEPPNPDDLRTAHRRRALLLLVAALPAGVLLWWSPQLLALVERWIVQDPLRQAARLRLVLAGIWSLLALPILILALWLWRLARATADSERFPPPGRSTVRPPTLRTGAAARRMALGARLLALLLLGALLLLALILLRLAMLIPPP